MIDAEPFERQIPSRTIMRLHGPRQEQRAFHRQFLHPVLHDAQLQRDDARDLDRAAKEISPSPWLKCRSPTLNLAPGTWIGRYTLEPRERFLISQLPPCSGRPGTVRAPSLPTFSFISSDALPACTLWGCGGRAITRPGLSKDETSSASRRFHSARMEAEGAQPRIPGWMRPEKRTWGMWRDEQKMPSRSQMAFALDHWERRSACWQIGCRRDGARVCCSLERSQEELPTRRVVRKEMLTRWGISHPKTLHHCSYQTHP